MGGLLGATSLAGCGTIQKVTGLKKEELGPVVVRNYTSSGADVTLSVEKAGNEILTEEYTLQAEGGENSRNVVYDWEGENEASMWTISAKTSSTDWVSENFGASKPPYCHVAEIRVRDHPASQVLIVVHDCAAVNVSTGPFAMEGSSS